MGKLSAFLSLLPSVLPSPHHFVVEAKLGAHGCDLDLSEQGPAHNYMLLLLNHALPKKLRVQPSGEENRRLCLIEQTMSHQDRRYKLACLC